MYYKLILLTILCTFFPQIVQNWCRQTLIQTNKQIRAIDTSKNEKYFAVAHSDSTVRIYSTRNYVQVASYSNGTGLVNSVRFSNDGTYLALGANNGRVHILNAYEPFSLNHTINDFTGSIVSVDFSEDSTFLASCADEGNGKVNIYPIANRIIQPSSASVNLPSGTGPQKQLRDCRFNKLTGTNIRLAVNNINRFIVYTTSLVVSIVDRIGTTTIKYFRMAYHPSNTSLIYIQRSTVTANKLHITGTSTATSSPIDGPIAGSSFFTNEVLNGIGYSPSGKYLATGGNTMKAYIFNNVSLVQTWKTSNIITCLAFNHDSSNERLYIADTNGQILVVGFACNLRNCPAEKYFDTTSNTCKLCSVITNCLTCINASICDRCVPGYYTDPNTNQCVGCGLLGCMTCNSNLTCTQCHSGFYMDTSTIQSNTAFTTPTTIIMNICSQCNKNIPGCAICNSSSICITCHNDYYLNGTTCNKCTNSNFLSSNCLKCYNSSTCIQCKIGYFVDGTTCSRCNPVCNACNGSATNCTQCTQGYYLNIPTSYTCTRCTTGCLSCNNTNFCFQCDNGMYQKSDGTCQLCTFPCLNCLDATICYLCNQGFYLNSTSNNNTCVRCTNNCQTCKSPTVCTTCQPGFYLITTATNNNTCASCSTLFPKCSYCSSSACQICSNGYFLNGTTTLTCQTCSSKMYKCQQCQSSTKCVSCFQGFYLTTNNANDSCASCTLGCQTCTDNTICKKCFPNYYLDTNNKCISCTNNCLTCKQNQQCIVCDEGYYLDGTVCQLCAGNITNCLQCKSGEECVSCEVGYYIDDTTKKCQECQYNCLTCNSSLCYICDLGYFLNSTPQCQPCSEICTTCYTATNCTSCIPGYYLNTTSSNNTCLKCSTLNRYCRTCSQTNCFSCIDGYYLDNSANVNIYKCSSCLSAIQGCLQCNSTAYCFACEYGYYLDTTTTNKCITCDTPLPGCQHCNDEDTCVKCIIGYYLDSVNHVCQICIDGCTTCNSSDACFSCIPGYYLNNITCLPCKNNIQGCNLCTDLDTCVVCMNGYYLNSSDNTCRFCRSALVGCLYCSSNITCTYCQPGFYLENDQCKTCSIAIAGCQLCLTDSQCQDCSTGYYLDASVPPSCTLCSATLEGCIACQDIDNCLICKSGYYLNTGNNKCQLCSIQNSGCLLCDPNPTPTPNIICKQCSTGFYLGTNNLCTGCTQKGCQICLQSSPTLCLTCDSSYFMNISSSQCQQCSQIIQGCNQCSNSSQCQLCDVGYYLNSSTKKCDLCHLNQNLVGCSKCQYNTLNTLICTKCKSTYILSSTNQCQICYQILQGCTYCTNSTYCASCANGYYRNSSTDKCQSCTKQSGCLLCQNQITCDYCSPGYYLDQSINKCIKCSVLIPFCMTCYNPTQCLSCESGFKVNDQNQCEEVTVTSTQKVEQLKFITEYVDQNTLSHKLFAKNLIYKNKDYNLTGQCNLYMTDYSQLSTPTRKIYQVLLQIKQIRFISDIQLLFITNNPAKFDEKSDIGFVNSKKNRLLVSAGTLDQFKVSLQMKQQAANTIMPNLYQVGDIIIDYSLNNPQFYMSYIKAQTNSTWYYSLFGYTVLILLIINYIIKTLKISKKQTCHHHFTGQLISHVISLKTIGMVLYPITFQLYSFCYGFTLVDIPWMNIEISQILSKKSDYIPNSFVMYYSTLSIASTFLISLVVFIILFIAKFIFISKNNQLGRIKYFQLIYNIFFFSILFSGSLSLQGALYNPLKIISINSLFYIIGILLYISCFIQTIHSVYKNKNNFYKSRIFIKTTLLSIAHINPITIFSITLIIDLLIIIGQYLLIEKQTILKTNKLKYLWLVNNVLLDVAMGVLFFYNKALLPMVMVISMVIIVVVIEYMVTFIYRQQYETQYVKKHKPLKESSSPQSSQYNGNVQKSRITQYNNNNDNDNDQKQIQKQRQRGTRYNNNNNKNTRHKNTNVNQSHQTLFNVERQPNKFNLWDVGDYNFIQHIQKTQINDQRINKIKKQFQPSPRDQKNKTSANFPTTNKFNRTKRQRTLKQDNLIMMTSQYTDANNSMGFKGYQVELQNTNNNNQIISLEEQDNENNNEKKNPHFLKTINKVNIRSKREMNNNMNGTRYNQED